MIVIILAVTKKTRYTRMLGLVTRNDLFQQLGSQRIQILTYYSCPIGDNNCSVVFTYMWY